MLIAGYQVLAAERVGDSKLAFTMGNRTLVIGRLDGTLEFYDATTGKVTRVVARN